MSVTSALYTDVIAGTVTVIVYVIVSPIVATVVPLLVSFTLVVRVLAIVGFARWICDVSRAGVVLGVSVPSMLLEGT